MQKIICLRRNVDILYIILQFSTYKNNNFVNQWSNLTFSIMKATLQSQMSVCLSICLSVSQQNPSTAWNHHLWSFILHHSFILPSFHDFQAFQLVSEEKNFINLRKFYLKSFTPLLTFRLKFGDLEWVLMQFLNKTRLWFNFLHNKYETVKILNGIVINNSECKKNF